VWSNVADWFSSFDVEGYSYCPDRTFINAFYRSSCDRIECLENVNCKTLAGLKNANSRNSYACLKKTLKIYRMIVHGVRNIATHSELLWKIHWESAGGLKKFHLQNQNQFKNISNAKKWLPPRKVIFLIARPVLAWLPLHKKKIALKGGVCPVGVFSLSYNSEFSEKTI